MRSWPIRGGLAELANQRRGQGYIRRCTPQWCSVSVEARRGKDLPGGELLIRPPGNHWGSRVGSPPSGQGGTPCLWAATPPLPSGPSQGREGQEDQQGPFLQWASLQPGLLWGAPKGRGGLGEGPPSLPGKGLLWALSLGREEGSPEGSPGIGYPPRVLALAKGCRGGLCSTGILPPPLGR